MAGFFVGTSSVVVGVVVILVVWVDVGHPANKTTAAINMQRIMPTLSVFILTLPFIKSSFENSNGLIHSGLKWCDRTLHLHIFDR